MRPNIPPRREAEFVPWLTNLHTRVVAEAGNFGVPSGTVTSFTSTYNAYLATYNEAENPETKTKANVQAKRDARQAMMPILHSVMGVIGAMPTVTDTERVLLGLHVRDHEPSPSPIPTEPPVAQVVAVNGWMAKIRLRSADTENRGKPPFVVGANIYTFVGDEPPMDVNLYKFEGDTTRPTFTVEFPPTLAQGTKVWIAANWKNARFQTGPACAPIGLLIGGGVTTLAS